MLVRRPFILATILYCCFLGVLEHRGFFSAVPAGDIAACCGDAYRQVTGTVADILPSARSGQRLLLNRLAVDGNAVHGTLLVTCFDAALRVERGEPVSVNARLSVPRAARNPGEFDYAAYLRRSGIRAVAYAHTLAVTGMPRLPWYQAIAAPVRERLVTALRGSVPAREANILIPMLIGEKHLLSPEDKQAFTDAGLMHLLVVSGLNVGYVAVIFLAVFRVFGLRRRYAAVLTIPFLVLFMVMVGNNPPVVRATVMALFVIISLSLSREPAIYQSLAMAAMAILIVDPQALFTASFQLSFAATIGIVYLYPQFMRPFSALPVLLRQSVGSTIAVSLAAQLAVLPLIAWYFNKISLAGILSNIVAVPLAGIATAGGVMIFLLHLAIPPLAVPVAAVTTLCLKVLLWSVYLFARLPWATVHVATPSLPATVAYYALLGGVFHVHRIPGRWRLPGIIALLALGGVLLAGRRLFPSHAVTLTSLAVGNGTAVHLAFPGNRHWLIDTGRSRDATKILCPYFWSRGIHRLDGIVITSGGQHHAGGLAEVVQNFPVATIICLPGQQVPTVYNGHTREVAVGEELRFAFSGSTLSIRMHGSRRDTSLLVFLESSGKRIAFVDHGNVPASGLPAPSVNLVHSSCHRKQTDITESIRYFHPQTVLCSGTVPEQLPAGPDYWAVQERGAVRMIIDDGNVRAR